MLRHTAVVLCVSFLLAAPLLAQTPLLTPPPGARAPRTVGAVTDCAEHGAWHAPPDWTVTAAGRDVVALSPGGRALLARVRARPRLRSDDTFLAQVRDAVERLVGAAPELGELSATDHGRWRRERVVSGHVSRGAVSLEVRARADRTGAFWVSVFESSDATAEAQMAAAVASWLQLVSHACACGTDCDGPRGGAR